jgi:ADP-heptose:LPS heptosyltransferase
MGFGKWLAGYQFAPQPPLDDLEDIFIGHFDAVFLQHDNSEKAKKIASLPLPVHIFYGAHIPSKHGPLRDKLDYICDPTQTMVDNIVRAIGKITGACSKENGLQPPLGSIFKKYPKRIAIHPTSSQDEKNWTRDSFLNLSEKLRKKGFEPVFTVSPKEREAWNAPHLPNLESLTSFLYESGGFIGNDSGLGHIASYLNLPHLIIGKSFSHMELWRPGWFPGKIAAPPAWTHHLKWTRNKWRSFITVNSITKMFVNEINSKIVS